MIWKKAIEDAVLITKLSELILVPVNKNAKILYTYYLLNYVKVIGNHLVSQVFIQLHLKLEFCLIILQKYQELLIWVLYLFSIKEFDYLLYQKKVLLLITNFVIYMWFDLFFQYSILYSFHIFNLFHYSICLYSFFHNSWKSAEMVLKEYLHK